MARTWNGIVNELFNDFDKTFAKPLGSINAPAVNIAETEEAFHLEVAAPGRIKENFSIKVENDTLFINYESKSNTSEKAIKTIRKEFSTDAFTRSFNLNDAVNAEAIAAKYEDGLLKVLLSKKQPAKPSVQQISIQ